MRGITIIFFTLMLFQVKAQEIKGDWQGKISYQGTELSIIFHIAGQQGEYSTSMDSPDQGATGIAVEKTIFEDGKLIIRDTNLNLEYSAELSESGDILNGTFNQQGISLALKMTRTNEKKSQ